MTECESTMHPPIKLICPICTQRFLEPEKPVFYYKEPDTCVKHDRMNCCEMKQKPKEKTMEWCEHIKRDKYGDFRFQRGESQYIVPDFWGGCPVADCLTPRPKQKELMELLAEKLCDSFDVFIKKWTGDSYPHLIDSDENDGERFREEIREAFLEKEGWKK